MKKKTHKKNQNLLPERYREFPRQNTVNYYNQNCYNSVERNKLVNVYRHVCSDSVVITRYGADVKLEWRQLPELHVRNWRDVGWLPQPARRCPRLQRAAGAVQERGRERLVQGRGLASSSQQRMLPGDLVQLQQQHLPCLYRILLYAE